MESSKKLTKDYPHANRNPYAPVLCKQWLLIQVAKLHEENENMRLELAQLKKDLQEFRKSFEL